MLQNNLHESALYLEQQLMQQKNNITSQIFDIETAYGKSLTYIDTQLQEQSRDFQALQNIVGANSSNLLGDMKAEIDLFLHDYSK